MFTDQQAIQRLSQISHEMKAISDLDGVWRALADTIRKRATTIATDHVDLGAPMRSQPRGKRRCFPVREQIDDAMLVEVHEQRAIACPTPEGKNRPRPACGGAGGQQ